MYLEYIYRYEIYVCHVLPVIFFSDSEEVITEADPIFFVAEQIFCSFFTVELVPKLTDPVGNTIYYGI
jgi:hypothetical protein